MISIKGKTELGNVFVVTINDDGITMRRQRDATGKVVNDNVLYGDRLRFSKGRFILRKGRKTTGETFGKTEITEILVI